MIYLATAPKSNRVYEAWNQAKKAAREYPAELVPKHIRNAPTTLMKDLGYGEDYRYDHAEDGHAVGGLIQGRVVRRDPEIQVHVGHVGVRIDAQVALVDV